MLIPGLSIYKIGCYNDWQILIQALALKKIIGSPPASGNDQEVDLDISDATSLWVGQNCPDLITVSWFL